MFINTYKILMTILFPLIKITYIRKRCRIGKEHPTRFLERLGLYTHQRPKGKLFWFHGASVGESISMLPLINKLLSEDEELSILVTTGTITSAEILQKRLPQRAFHQFIPYDVPKFARRLLDYYRPDAALWFESELWPSLLSETHKRNIPLILVNGRISDKSFKLWQRFKLASQELLSCFSLCLGQSEQDKDRLLALGAKNAECYGNIKYAGQPLPCDENKLKELKESIKDRKIFLISSTHHNEEEQLAEFLPQLQKNIPDILTIVVPRHPNRGPEISAMFQKKGYKTAERSKNESISPSTDIYIADTIGEMGLWYKLSEVCFIGGSLIPHGGQNFIEPARDKCAVIVGPYMHNFKDMTDRAQKAEAIFKVENAQEVINQAITLLASPQKMAESREKAYIWTVKESEVLDDICAALKKELTI